MTSMRFGGIKSKLQKFSFSPSRDRPPKSENEDKSQGKPKKISYKKKIKQRYNLTDLQFEDEKIIAQNQLKNWEDYRKEQVLRIFQSSSEYVSKSKKSDVCHPKLAKANVVLNSRGEKVEVEFGRLREFYLCTLAPCKEFASIKDHIENQKQLMKVREKENKKKMKNNSTQVTEEREAHNQKKFTEYEESKSLYGTPGAPQKAKITQREKDEAEDTAPSEKFVTNTTDDKHNQFPETWYRQSMTRTKLKPGRMNYWLGNGEDEDVSVDDDPEGKYTVTVERLIETLTLGGKIKDSGVVEPTVNVGSKAALADPVSSILSRYKKTCGKEANYLNTLKGTIDFSKNRSAEPTLSSNTITQDDPTDAPNQITFDSTISAHVFKGKRMKRQNVSRKDLETYEESRKDYTREAGEETSGI